MNKWKLLTVVIDGEHLEIEGVNVWEFKWQTIDEPKLSVPHPSYPSQQHELSPCYIESNDKKILFAAGELSNCVWCFYVPT
jgi:hypothetical protein